MRQNWHRYGNWIAAIAMLLLVNACAEEESGQGHPDGLSTAESETGSGRTAGCQTIDGTETVKIEGVLVNLMAPKGKYQGDIVVLHAWDDGREAWCQRSRLCIQARKKGYRLIMPEMGKSIYHHRNYPETRADWQKYPSIDWIKEKMIPGLRKEYCMLQPKGNNFVIGVSAGARGAVLLATELPELFVAGAALSGDYNPAEMRGDNIYRGFLGNYDEFPERWVKDENVLSRLEKFRTPFYLAHGMQDDLVDFQQSKALYNVLQRDYPNLNMRLNLPPKEAHGYAFWNKQIPEIFQFFASMQADLPEGP